MQQTPDKLSEMLAAQDLLQIEAYGGTSPRTLLHSDPTEAIKFITWNVLALEDELHELLGETGWKPWATSNHVNLEAARGEAIDALHFLLNLFLVLGMDPEMIHEKYMAKRQKNADRQADGYDGVTTKCPSCKRALDDDAVTCHRTPNSAQTDGGETFWCGQVENYIFTAPNE